MELGRGGPEARHATAPHYLRQHHNRLGLIFSLVGNRANCIRGGLRLPISGSQKAAMRRSMRACRESASCTACLLTGIQFRAGEGRCLCLQQTEVGCTTPQSDIVVLGISTGDVIACCTCIL